MSYYNNIPQEDRNLAHQILDRANLYALKNSGCNKVQVGSAILTTDVQVRSAILTTAGSLIFGSNYVIGNLCVIKGCQRIELYGEDSKNHRLPSDCRSLHSEINAICTAVANGKSTYNAKIYITRYPCEACARAIVAAGIREVYYGREQEISDQTKEIFDLGGVKVYWVKDWIEKDVLR